MKPGSLPARPENAKKRKKMIKPLIFTDNLNIMN